MANKMYICSKSVYETSNSEKCFIMEAFGEIQSNYNMSLVIDGTKDSCKVVVFNNERKEIDPITICYLEETQTWWIVQSDKVKRYKNENGSFYEHTISLVGAFEILNYRDLTNCGFNANRYTISTFFNRLANKTDFELPLIWDFGGYVDTNQKITYLKTFQNYTPASAIKEMFNGMNIVPKMRFTFYYNSVYGFNCAKSPEIYCIPKSGINSQTINAEEIFTSEEEQNSSNAESFGSRVISNVENCVSGETIKYPNYGGIRLVSDEETISESNGFLRLPSNIYEVKGLTMYANIDFVIPGEGKFNFRLNEYDKNTLLDRLIEYCEYRYVDNDFQNAIKENWDYIYERLVASGKIYFPNGGEYDRIDETWNDKVISMDTNPGADTSHLFLNDKQHGTTAVYRSWNAMYWEQGKDKIENFEWLNHGMNRQSGQEGYILLSEYGAGLLSFDLYYDLSSNFVVDYIPMTDLKVKVDNSIDQNDSNIFNQNGKFVDASAVSKLLNSYAKEISSNEVVRYGTFYNYQDIPQIGQLVSLYNDIYIINNVSIDFYENEYEEDTNVNGDKYMICQFAMTKQVACKSTMISANTNIRDYECPQQNNVPRIQIYRDYFEFGYQDNQHSENAYYTKKQDIFNFGESEKGFAKNYNFMFKTTIDHNGIENYYYVIGTTKYNLNKQEIVIADFRDNNIIGNEHGKSYYTLSVAKLREWITSPDFTDVNVPISYVNDYGEVIGFDFKFIDGVDMEDAYNGNEDLIGKSFSIPYQFWELTDEPKVFISEQDYYKDGLEVPVFEYCCEVGDNNGIVFGESFLSGDKVENYTNDSDFIFLYTITRFPSNEIITQENGSKYRNALGNNHDDRVDIVYNDTYKELSIYIDSTTGINIGDNFAINMICCNNSLVIGDGWFADSEKMLFCVNKCKVASSIESHTFTYVRYYTLDANSSKTINITLGHGVLPEGEITVLTGNVNVSATQTTYYSNNVRYATIVLTNNSNSKQSGKCVVGRPRNNLRCIKFKVNNWKLR